MVMSFFSNFFTPRSSFTPEQTQRIRRAIMPFSDVDEYRGKGQVVRQNFRQMQQVNRMLLILFVLNSVLMCVTAIYAPKATSSAFFYAWQVAQFCFLLVLAYRFGRKHEASS